MSNSTIYRSLRTHLAYSSPPSPATPTEPSFDDFADVFVVNDEATAETATACAVSAITLV